MTIKRSINMSIDKYKKTTSQNANNDDSDELEKELEHINIIRDDDFELEM